MSKMSLSLSLSLSLSPFLSLRPSFSLSSSSLRKIESIALFQQGKVNQGRRQRKPHLTKVTTRIMTMERALGRESAPTLKRYQLAKDVHPLSPLLTAKFHPLALPKRMTIPTTFLRTSFVDLSICTR